MVRRQTDLEQARWNLGLVLGSLVLAKQPDLSVALLVLAERHLERQVDYFAEVGYLDPLPVSLFIT